MGIPTGLLCGIPVGLLCGIPTGLLCGIPAGLLCGIPAGLLCRIPAGLLCGIPTRIPVTKSVTNPTGLVPHRLCETVPQESYRTFSLGPVTAAPPTGAGTWHTWANVTHRDCGDDERLAEEELYYVMSNCPLANTQDSSAE